MVKSGKTTYFLDVREAKNNSKYVSITASSPSKEDPKKFSKRSVLVFSNAVDEFVGALQEAVVHCKE
jgi:hypothetical protein